MLLLPTQEIFVGSDFSMNLDGITRNLGSFRVTGDTETSQFRPLERKAILKRIVAKTCRIICEGAESTVAGGGTFKAITSAWLNETAPSAVSWNNKATTPESWLPDEFFDDEYFPLASWRFLQPEGGPSGQGDTVLWRVTLEPNF